MELLKVLEVLGMFVLSGFAAVLWWMFREVKTKVEDGARELAVYKLHVAEKYVNHTDLAEAMSGIKEVMGNMLRSLDNIQVDMKAFTNRIYDKLDNKVDKS